MAGITTTPASFFNPTFPSLVNSVYDSAAHEKQLIADKSNRMM
jgi:hypothetical protein